MPKAGLFHGVITTNAPADGAVTSKAKGTQWMEYAEPALPAPAQDRVLAWWEFEEPSAHLQDLFSDVGDAMLSASNNYASVTGVRGQGARLQITGNENITSQSSPVGSIDPLTLRDQIWGVTFWWKTPSTLVGVAGQYLVCQWAASVPVTGGRKWRVIYNPTENGFVCSIGTGPSTSTFVDLDTGNIGLKVDTWYHIAMTYDPVADEMTITPSERGGAVGTRFAGAQSGGAFDVPNSDYQITVGRDFAGVVLTDGICDMLAFWDTQAILSVDDVTALFEGELIYSELST